ncbi:MAG: class II fructose-bisphosphate aldolase [Lachnospiraceae bacterium]|nr:class II fructose-bisphosphate aldolase [Lachnospiraceae bacterium]
MVKYIHSGSQQYFAFNIWNTESAKAVIDGAGSLHCDVILQTSMNAFELSDKEELAAFVHSYASKTGIQAYLHLDHCKNETLIYEAIESGWDSVMIDASHKSLQENIDITNKITAVAKKRNILVEAEIGQIYGQEDDMANTADGIVRFEDLSVFVKYTKVDMLAAAVGTVHGIYRGTPNIQYDLIDHAAAITDVPLVIHGGTGLSDETLSKLLAYKNIKKINISTDVKLAYRQGIEESILAGLMEKEGFNPLEVSKRIHDSIQTMTMHKLRLLRKEQPGENNTCPEYGNEKHSKYYF